VSPFHSPNRAPSRVRRAQQCLMTLTRHLAIRSDHDVPSVARERSAAHTQKRSRMTRSACSNQRTTRHTAISVFLLVAITCLVLCAAAATISPSRADARPLRQETVFSPVHGKDIRAGVLSRLGLVVSTWYGPGFWGHRTGCGRSLRHRSWGVAHRTLPCGSLVLLKFHGRQVAVPVIDRGPYSGATLDLTERTAEFLHFKQAGGGSVKLTVLDRRLPIRRL